MPNGSVAPPTADARTTADRIARYDRPGPRYTSYPTAVEFHEGFGPDAYAATLAAAARRPDDPLSAYVHLPFCAERCAFCGCNVIVGRDPGLADRYLDHLEREIALVAEALGERRTVVQLHWGGGTPSFLTTAQMARLMDAFEAAFALAPGAEVAIEVDPRVTTPEQVAWLAERGFTRVSMGVQDFDAAVQDAIGRHQTALQTTALYRRFRAAGIVSINLDLVYGLPAQTLDSFDATLDRTLALRPDRVAVYAYAHLPRTQKNQTRIDETLLPSQETRLLSFGLARQRFLEAGYVPIGMDHFALPGDGLARAAEDRTLHRNFMGYTTQVAPDVVAFGTSAIGEVDGAFAQNTKKLNRYEAALAEDRFPVERGYARTADDALRSDVIRALMVNLHLDVRDVERRHGIDFAAYFADALATLRAGPEPDGFVRIAPETLEVTEAGRLFVRNVAMAFDAHLAKHRGTGRFSRTV